jgi:hypothetical protein
VRPREVFDNLFSWKLLLQLAEIFGLSEIEEFLDRRMYHLLDGRPNLYRIYFGCSI